MPQKLTRRRGDAEENAENTRKDDCFSRRLPSRLDFFASHPVEREELTRKRGDAEENVENAKTNNLLFSASSYALGVSASSPPADELHRNPHRGRVKSRAWINLEHDPLRI